MKASSENAIGKTARQTVDRRSFLKTAATSSLAVAIPAAAMASTKRLAKSVSIGLIADLHQDVMHDGVARITEFLEAMTQSRPNATMQLGDFAYPNKRNEEVISLFNSSSDRPLHVIGNHDTDAGHTKQQCIDIWGMPSRYYVKDIDGLNVLVLDGNDTGSPTHGGGYPSYVGPEQTAWLKQQLATLAGPILIVSHQPLAGAWAIDNASEIQAVLGEAADKIVLAINGHSHIDDTLRMKGVTYVHVNSASYQWVGSSYQHQSYESEIHADFPHLRNTCPYKECLFATLTIDPEQMTVRIQGRSSHWVGASPAELGVDLHPALTNGVEIAPAISDREILRIAT